MAVIDVWDRFVFRIYTLIDKFSMSPKATFVDKFWAFTATFYGAFAVALLYSAEYFFGPYSVVELTYWTKVGEAGDWFARNMAGFMLTVLMMPYAYPKIFGTQAAKVALCKMILPVQFLMLGNFYLVAFELSTTKDTTAPAVGAVDFNLWIPQMIMHCFIVLGNISAIVYGTKGSYKALFFPKSAETAKPVMKMKGSRSKTPSKMKAK